jgi:hypothetical protein
VTGPLSGWVALALVPLTAIAAWVLRRFVRGNFVRRMRPHFVLGYATLAFALVHVWTSMGSMRGANSTGIWLATLALFALGFQALVGTNLQSPGAFRLRLRAWHLIAFAAVAVLAAGHVGLNAPITSQFTRDIGDASIVEHPIGVPLRVAQQRFGIFEKAPFAAHPVNRMRGGEVSAGAAPARVPEEPDHPPFVRLDLLRAFAHERDGVLAAELSQQYQRGL